MAAGSQYQANVKIGADVAEAGALMGGLELQAGLRFLLRA
jgi:hypothetical protein